MKALNGISALACMAGAMLIPAQTATMQPTSTLVIRIAELEIDHAQLEAYKAALREEIEAALRIEPGVLRLLAVQLKDHPDQIRLFETYASPEAYQAHIQSPHFLKYKQQTASMVKSLRLIETDPILLGDKSH